MAAQPKQFTYRGFGVKWIPLTRQWQIDSGGTVIAWVSTAKAARREIDAHAGAQRTNNPGPRRHSAAWDRCVRDVKRKGSAVSPYAVCTASLQELSFRGKNPVRDPAHRKLVSQLKKHFEMDERALRKKNPSRRRGPWPKGKVPPHLKRFSFK